MKKLFSRQSILPDRTNQSESDGSDSYKYFLVRVDAT